MTDDWQPPRCGHDYDVIACPYDDCPFRTAYLDQRQAAERDLQRHLQFIAALEEIIATLTLGKP